MKKILLIFGFWVLLSSICFAEGLQYEAITVADTAIGFTASKISPPVYGAFCTVETASIRIRYDGTVPTASEGHPFNAGQYFILTNAVMINNFRAIRSTSTSATLRCTYW